MRGGMSEIEDLKRQLDETRAALDAIKGTPGDVSPLAPKTAPTVHAVPGVTLSSIAAEVRYQGRDDVMMMRMDAGSTLAGVFTKSATRSAPVLWCERALSRLAEGDGAIGVIANAGNSNAFTGAAGEESTEAMATRTASALGTTPDRVFVASTGVIGERLPHQKIEAVIDTLAGSLAADGWARGAGAIMTTDTFPKLASVQCEIDGATVTISGMAKGSGMIAPDMATMLAFAATDANIGQAALQALLVEGTDVSFNAVTVDGDTSTSDTLLLGATGKAAHDRIEDAGDARLDGFRDALRGLLQDLAHQVVRDGEGASKFIEVRVTGAETDAAAKIIALSIANSPLVKTAFAGEDPNWGRIVMAVGKSGEKADRDALTIHFGDILVAEKGWVAHSYREEDGAEYMRAEDLVVTADVGVGSGAASVWTCDLTYAYVRINADYRS